ncbi:hypothetical protein DFH27DRAFT_653478 [Peziza echinospora]|nr:hypothetical protein DFH27DRAFT_653478 [Peziza echinospora]
MCYTPADFIVLLLTIFFPPLGVLIIAGCGGDIVVSCVLTFLGYIPGLIHGIYVYAVWVNRKRCLLDGLMPDRPAPAIFSTAVQVGEPACFCVRL